MIQSILPAVSADVLAFAEEQGFAPYLPSALELAQRLFPSAETMALQVELDPELRDERHIILDVYTSMSAVEGVAAYRQWNEGMRAFCPGPLLCVFILRLNEGM